MENIRKPRHNVVLNVNVAGFRRCEFAVIEAFVVSGISLHVPAIEQYFLSFIFDDSLKQFQERLFGSFQRELSACIYDEKSGFKMHVLLHATFAL